MTPDKFWTAVAKAWIAVPFEHECKDPDFLLLCLSAGYDEEIVDITIRRMYEDGDAKEFNSRKLQANYDKFSP